MTSALPRSIRLRASLCHLVGPVGLILPCVLLIGQWVFLYWLLSNGFSLHLGLSGIIARVILFLILLMDFVGRFSGFFLTLWVWRSQLRHHPFIDQCGRKAFRLQRTVASGLLLALVLSVLVAVVMSAVGLSGDEYPPAIYVLNTTLDWFGKASFVILLLAAPLSLFGAVQAYRGRSG
jgi:uncharacterized Tic20 family protein